MQKRSAKTCLFTNISDSKNRKRQYIREKNGLPIQPCHPYPHGPHVFTDGPHGPHVFTDAAFRRRVVRRRFGHRASPVEPDRRSRPVFAAKKSSRETLDAQI